MFEVFRVGDKIWNVSQCFPVTKTNRAEGTPYRQIVRKIYLKNGITRYKLSGVNNRGASDLYHQLGYSTVMFMDLRSLYLSYSHWKLNSPVDYTIPTEVSIQYLHSNNIEEVSC